MPSLASGKSSCTACAMTCAVEWRRMFRPSSEEISTGSTVSPSFTSYARSFSSPAMRAATMVRSPAKSSAAVVPVATTRSSRSESRWMITRTSDTGLS